MTGREGENERGWRKGEGEGKTGEGEGWRVTCLRLVDPKDLLLLRTANLEARDVVDDEDDEEGDHKGVGHDGNASSEL